MKANYETEADSLEIQLVDEVDHLDEGRDFAGGVIHELDDRPAVVDVLGASTNLEEKIRSAAEETGADGDSLLLLARTAIANPERVVVVELLERA